MIDNRLIIVPLVVMVLGSVIIRFTCRPALQRRIFAIVFLTYIVAVLRITILSRTPSPDIKVRFDIVSQRQIFRMKFAEDGSLNGLKIGHMYWEGRLNVLLLISFGYLVCTALGMLRRWWIVMYLTSKHSRVA